MQLAEGGPRRAAPSPPPAEGQIEGSQGHLADRQTQCCTEVIVGLVPDTPTMPMTTQQLREREGGGERGGWGGERERKKQTDRQTDRDRERN